MRFRSNRREINLAAVSPEKAEEDTFQTSGIFAMYSYFDSQTRKAHKVKMDGKYLTYEKSGNRVSNGTYMYAVGKNGALYIGTPTVHSQFKAGQDTQSAGWIKYQFSEATFNITIDNCSGHYTPSLSQFISTLYGLHQTGVLPDNFTIKLNRFTKIDYSGVDLSFWENAINSSLINGETSKIISVNFLSETQGFKFENDHSETCLLSKENILQKGGFTAPQK